MGIICTAAEYMLVCGVPYVLPVHPGVLIIPAGTPQHAAVGLRKDHKLNLRIFRESIDVQKALIKQIVQAIEPKYLNSLRNRTTNTINISVQDILAHLMTRYGIVEDDTLGEKELQVREMLYDLLDPLVTLFSEIEDLEQLGIAANNPYTAYQLITFSLQIIKNTRDFEDGMKTWHVRPMVDKTWNNFKLHFETEHASLRRVRGTTMRSTAYHQANLLASQVLNEVKEVKTSVTEALNMLSTGVLNEENMSPPSENKANSASHDEGQREILRW